MGEGGRGTKVSSTAFFPHASTNLNRLIRLPRGVGGNPGGEQETCCRRGVGSSATPGQPIKLFAQKKRPAPGNSAEEK